MPKIAFEALVVPNAKQSTVLIADTRSKRPLWRYILREEIEPLCATYGLIIEYGDEDDESCALFYDDGLPWPYVCDIPEYDRQKPHEPAKCYILL